MTTYQTLLSFIVLFIINLGYGKAQTCSVTDTFAQTGFAPPSDQWSCVERGNLFEQTLYFQAYDSATFNGQEHEVDYMVIDSLKNLPCGIAWTTSNSETTNPSNKFQRGEEGCIHIKGTTTDSSGFYLLDMVFKIKLKTYSFPIKVNTNNFSNNLFLLVKEPADTCPLPVEINDTSETSVNGNPNSPNGNGPTPGGSTSVNDTSSDEFPYPTETSTCYTEWNSGKPSNAGGMVFDDKNTNGVFDSNDTKLENFIVEINPGPVYATTDSSGEFDASLDTGSYTIDVIVPSNWTATTASSDTFTIQSSSDEVTDLDFGVQSTPNVKDLRVDFTTGIPVAASTMNSWINYENIGTVTSDGTIELKLDSSLSFKSSTPSPSSKDNNKIEWKFSDLEKLDKENIALQLTVDTVKYDTPLQSTVRINSSSFSDDKPTNNVDTLNQTVFSSYDPNDKLTSPNRKKRGMAQNYTRFDEKIEYTVRFQNTGNYKASKVRIEDTLNQHLDVSTFDLIASSHEVDYEINGEGNVIFTFKNIILPDSGSNMEGSKGFVKFAIEADNDINKGTVIDNTAHIYFDYNPAIVTNTTQNTMVDQFPSTTTSITSSINKDDIKGYVAPNPFNQSFTVRVKGGNISSYTFKLYNLMGKQLKSYRIQDGTTHKIDAHNLSSGMYLYRIELQDGRHSTGKLMAK